MANALSGNVQFVDTTATIAAARRINTIKYIGTAAGSVSITSVDTSAKVYEASGSTNQSDSNLNIEAPSGVTVTIVSSGSCYLYLALR